MKSEWQQQSFQGAIDKWCQDWCCISRIGNPQAEIIDALLDNRPYHSHNQGNNSGISDYHHWYETFAIEESQYIRQLPEVIIFIVGNSTHKTGNDTNEHAHIQSWCPQNTDEVVLYQQLLTKKGINNGIRISQHIVVDAEDGTGDAVNQAESNDGCKGTAGPFLGPRTTDGDGKEHMKVADKCPAHILQYAAQGHYQIDISAPQLHNLADRQSQAGRRHNSNNCQQYLAQVLQQVKIYEAALFLRLRCSFFSLCRCRLWLFLCQLGFDGVYQGLTSLDLTLSSWNIQAALTTAVQHRSSGRNIMLLQICQIHGGNQIPRLNLGPLFYLDVKRLALQGHGFQPHMK